MSPGAKTVSPSVLFKCRSKRRQSQRPFERKCWSLSLIVVKQPGNTVKSGYLPEFCFHSVFQIAKQVMLSMTRPVDLIILVVWIFA